MDFWALIGWDKEVIKVNGISRLATATTRPEGTHPKGKAVPSSVPEGRATSSVPVGQAADPVGP